MYIVKNIHYINWKYKKKITIWKGIGLYCNTASLKCECDSSKIIFYSYFRGHIELLFTIVINI
jgi:hypothetical protein